MEEEEERGDIILVGDCKHNVLVSGTRASPSPSVLLKRATGARWRRCEDGAKAPSACFRGSVRRRGREREREAAWFIVN